VVPAAGINVQLPSRGLVVLTSLGFGAPIRLNQGTVALLDNLNNWSSVYGRSGGRGLRLDAGDPAVFDDDPSRAEVTGRRDKYLIYRAGQMTSFELKAYYKRALNLTAFGSLDGTSWTPIALSAPAPAPVLGGRRYLEELLPAAPLPAGTNELKLEFGGDTQLGQVRIEAGRTGPACLAPSLGSSTTAIGNIALANSGRILQRLFGTPSVRGRHIWRYCVAGGGEVAVVLARRGGASLIASTAAGYSRRGVGVGSPVTTLIKRFRRGGVQSLGRQMLLGNGDVVFVVAGGHVVAVAIPDGGLLARPRLLVATVRAATTPFRAGQARDPGRPGD
jgi:hypothetical protein